MPYTPDHDLVEDRALLLDVIARHPLATLITHDGRAPDADLIPLLAVPDEASDEIALLGHVARSNPLWRGGQQGPVLAVFTAAEHYISPTWYPSKEEHHRTVPTWNYVVVHCWGELEVHDDPRWVRSAVARLTHHQEAGSGRESPWRMGMAPREYIEKELEQIVGIRIPITRMTGRFKVSSHKSDADRLGARDGVARERGGAHADELAALMSDPPQHRRASAPEE